MRMPLFRLRPLTTSNGRSASAHIPLSSSLHPREARIIPKSRDFH